MDDPGIGQQKDEDKKEETVDEEDVQGRKKVARAVKYPSVPRQYWREVDADLNFGDLEWDLQATQGQARPFSNDILQARLKDFSECLPSGKIKVVVWPQDAFGMANLKTRVFKISFPSFQTTSSLCWVVSIHRRPCPCSGKTFLGSKVIEACQCH